MNSTALDRDPAKDLYYYSHPDLPSSVDLDGKTWQLALNTGRKCDSDGCPEPVDSTEAVQGQYAKLYHNLARVPSGSGSITFECSLPTTLPTVKATGRVNTYYDTAMGASREIWGKVSEQFTPGHVQTEPGWLWGHSYVVAPPAFRMPIYGTISPTDRLVYVTGIGEPENGTVAAGDVSRVEDLLVARELAKA